MALRPFPEFSLGEFALSEFSLTGWPEIIEVDFSAAGVASAALLGAALALSAVDAQGADASTFAAQAVVGVEAGANGTGLFEPYAISYSASELNATGTSSATYAITIDPEVRFAGSSLAVFNSAATATIELGSSGQAQANFGCLIVENISLASADFSSVGWGASAVNTSSFEALGNGSTVIEAGAITNGDLHTGGASQLDWSALCLRNTTMVGTGDGTATLVSQAVASGAFQSQGLGLSIFDGSRKLFSPTNALSDGASSVNFGAGAKLSVELTGYGESTIFFDIGSPMYTKLPSASEIVLRPFELRESTRPFEPRQSARQAETRTSNPLR